MIYRRITNNNCNYFCKNNLIRGIISMCSSINEETANDSYLIVKGEEKEMKKISYRGNLIEEFKDDDAVYSKIQHIKTDAKGLRQIAEIVEEYGYSIYHLTQL